MIETAKLSDSTEHQHPENQSLSALPHLGMGKREASDGCTKELRPMFHIILSFISPYTPSVIMWRNARPKKHTIEDVYRIAPD